MNKIYLNQTKVCIVDILVEIENTTQIILNGICTFLYFHFEQFLIVDFIQYHRYFIYFVVSFKFVEYNFICSLF